MICRRDVVALVTKVKKVSVADLLESMEVRLSISRHKVARIYKLKMKLKETEFVSSRDIKSTLEGVFTKEMENAIESHVNLLSRISGIKHIKCSPTPVVSSDADEDDSGARTRKGGDDEDDEDDDDDGDDLGSDAQKRKQQASDEMDYDDESDSDHGEDELSADTEKRKSDNEDLEDMDTSKGEGAEHSDRENEDDTQDDTRDEQNEDDGSNKKDAKVRRAVKCVFEGSSFEVHFQFTNEPHVLLAQVIFLN